MGATVSGGKHHRGDGRASSRSKHTDRYISTSIRGSQGKSKQEGRKHVAGRGNETDRHGRLFTDSAFCSHPAAPGLAPALLPPPPCSTVCAPPPWSDFRRRLDLRGRPFSSPRVSEWDVHRLRRVRAAKTISSAVTACALLTTSCAYMRARRACRPFQSRSPTLARTRCANHRPEASELPQAGRAGETRIHARGHGIRANANPQSLSANARTPCHSPAPPPRPPRPCRRLAFLRRSGP